MAASASPEGDLQTNGSFGLITGKTGMNLLLM
jgi:hypothetical protein